MTTHMLQIVILFLTTGAAAGADNALASATISPDGSVYLIPSRPPQMFKELNEVPASVDIDLDGSMDPIPPRERSLVREAVVVDAEGEAEEVGGGPDLTVGEEAGQILADTNSGGLVSAARKMATINLALKALSDTVSGDFVETGVFNGGTAVLMAKVLMVNQSNRKLWAADSFAGLPAESPTELARERDSKDPGRVGSQGQYSSSRRVFEENLETNGLGNSTTNNQIQVLSGWFNDTLPTAPINEIAFLRLDGDIYASTMDGLTNLYDKVVPGGYIYVDDYGSYAGCKNAVDDFRSAKNIEVKMHEILEEGDQFEALWWQKTSEA